MLCNHCPVWKCVVIARCGAVQISFTEARITHRSCCGQQPYTSLHPGTSLGASGFALALFSSHFAHLFIAVTVFTTNRHRFMVTGRIQHQVIGDLRAVLLRFSQCPKQPTTFCSVMLEYDIGITDDTKKAVASIADKLFDRYVFRTLRTQMQVWPPFPRLPLPLHATIIIVTSQFLRSSATLLRPGSACTSRLGA